MTYESRESVTVRIAGEEHTIRSSAEPEYTTRCARYVDKRIHEIKKQVGLVEGQKLGLTLNVPNRLAEDAAGGEERQLKVGLEFRSMGDFPTRNSHRWSG